MSTPTTTTSTTTATTTANTAAAPAVSNKKNIPCRFYRTNSCRFGDACSFSHDITPIATNGTSSSSHIVPPHAAPVLVALQPGVPLYSIDVECVATGKQHNARSTAQIALVNAHGQPVLNLYVAQTEKVESYLTPLTGLTKDVLDDKGIPLEEAMKKLRAALPKEAVLVGQNIGKDVEWLKLKEGEDFSAMVDLAALLRVWNDRYNSFTYFGLSHAAQCWLGIKDDGEPHNAVTDAQKSVRLFSFYCRLQHTPAELSRMQQKMLETPVKPSFAKANPTFEECCMGNRKTCSCGAPFFS